MGCCRVCRDLLFTFTPFTAHNHYGCVLVAQGRTDQEIAKKLFLRLKTVQNYVSNIFLKLQVAHRSQAVIRAREAGLGTTNE